MPTYTDTFQLSTKGETDIHDITGEINSIVKKSGIKVGIVNACVQHSTCGITTIEYESGLISDIKDALERIAPRHGNYAHDRAWGDGNGHSHIRSSVIGSSFSAPIRDGHLLLGTWQQIILCDFDNRHRTRNINITVVGD